MNSNTLQVLIAMVLYMAAVIMIGVFYAKRANKNSEAFYLGGRSLGPWVTAMSAEASDMSGWLLMGLPGVAYLSGVADASWTAIGLAVGIGFYVGAFITVFAVMFTFTLITRVEHFMNRKRQRMAIYLELEHVDAVSPMLDMLRSEYGLLEAQVTPPRSGNSPHVGLEILVRVPQKLSTDENLKRFSSLDRVVFALRNI